jgi:predicted metal-dependent hydrolase
VGVAIVHHSASGGTYSFLYGDEVIPFECRLRKGESPRIRIKVEPDCRVVVFAPENAGDDQVLRAVRKRGRWIYQHLRQFRAYREHASPRSYISGETHFYLGRRYLLNVMADPGASGNVKLLRGRLDVTATRKDPDLVRALITSWYKDRAKEVFSRRLDILLPQALWVDERPPIRVQTMKTQWGSCSPAGRLTLNPHLVKASQDCIDYVILHELCHLAEHNHSRRFYRLLEQVMPGWKKVKDRLDGRAQIWLS